MGKRDIIMHMLAIGKSIDEISDLVGIPSGELHKLIN